LSSNVDIEEVLQTTASYEDKSKDWLWTEELLKPYIKNYLIKNHGVKENNYFDNSNDFIKKINTHCEWRVNKYTDDIIFKHKDWYFIIDVESTLPYFISKNSIDSEKKFDDSFYWDIDYLISICDNRYIEEWLRVLKWKWVYKISFKQLYKSYFPKLIINLVDPQIAEENLKINNDKTASYRIKNAWMKNGKVRQITYIKNTFVEKQSLKPIEALLYTWDWEIEISYNKTIKVFNSLFKFYQKVLLENNLRLQKSICYSTVVKTSEKNLKPWFEVYIVSINYKNFIEHINEIYCKINYTYKLYHRWEKSLLYYNLLLKNNNFEKWKVDTRVKKNDKDNKETKKII